MDINPWAQLTALIPFRSGSDQSSAGEGGRGKGRKSQRAGRQASNDVAITIDMDPTDPPPPPRQLERAVPSADYVEEDSGSEGGGSRSDVVIAVTEI